MSGLMQKFKEMWLPSEEEYDDEYDEQAEENEEAYENERPREKVRNRGKNNNRVVNIHSTAKLQVVLFKPERFGEETRTIADELLKMHTIVLNLEETSKDAARRILDFLSGVAYANGGQIKRVATGTFVITPYNVDLTGTEVIDELENSGIYF